MYTIAVNSMGDMHREEDHLEVELTDLDVSESSATGRYTQYVQEWFQHKVRHPRVVYAGITVILILLFSLLVLRSALPESNRPVSVQRSVSPSVNLFTVVQSGPGELFVVTPDGQLSALHPGIGTAIWRYRVDSGIWGSPIVMQGIIFVNTVNGRVIALQATTGKVLWIHHIPAFSSSVLQVMQDGIVFVRNMAVRTPGGNVAALRVSDGSLLWQFSTFHFAGFVVLEGAGVAYIRDASSRITSVGIRDGLPLWATHTTSSNWLTAIDNRVFVATRDGDIDALDASNGTLLWHTHLRTGALGAPLISGESVFIPTATGGMSVLAASSGVQRWEAESEPLIIASGLVYSLTSDGHMSVLLASNGTPLRGYQHIESIVPTEVNGTIFAMTDRGDLIALQARNGSVRWRWQSPAPISAVNLATASTLVYVSMGDDGVAALRVSDGSLFWNIGEALQQSGV